MKIQKHKRTRVRSIVQTVFFLWVVAVVLLSEAVENGYDIPFIAESVSLHAICPFGGVVTLYNLIKDGIMVKKIHDSAVVLAGLGVVLAVFFGPVFCGWICPFGTFQEWVGRLGKKLFKRRYNTFVPKKLDVVLRYLRYVVLAWVLVMTALSLTLVFEPYDPYYALFSILRNEVSVSGLIILGIVVLLTLFVERPFCKYACPYGAFLGIFNKFRIFRIRRAEQTCIHCSACDRACPMNIEVSSKHVVSSHQCISCMQCTSEQACPVAETVVTGFSQKRRPIRPRTIGLLAIGILAAGILLSVALGWWKTTSSKVPARISEGEFAGYSNPADIRGSYTYNDISEAFPVSSAILVQAFGAADGSEQVKSLEERYLSVIPEGTELGTDSVRLFVALYTGLPYETEEGTLLPQSAIVVLKAEGKTTDPRFAVLQDHAVSLSDTPVAVPTVRDEETTGTFTVTGKSTFKELLDAGYAKEDLEALVGPIPSTAAVVKTIVESKGLSFSEIKAAISALPLHR
ncbi:MAG: 4Fe-4S binding protein [Sphaerochaeta sp.]|jgi:polyferredoxin|uniref:4Fe-4S binding protein n=1 Tax=Sphaerochaeta sp. TaxID=1972642 RepID=UPI002FCB439C